MKHTRYFAGLTKIILVLVMITLMITPLSAGDAKDDWVLLSDIHLPGDYDKVLNNQAPNHNFAQVRDEILLGDFKPAGVMITGDVVFLQGEADDYRTLAKQLEPFSETGISVYPLLGNHDNYENFAVNAEKYAIKDTPVKGKQVAVVETPNANWFFLDSHINTGTGAGLLGDAQLLWLADELDKRADKPAILAAHHNLDPGKGSLQDEPKFWGIVKSHKQVKAYIYGHTHIYRASVRDDVHLINLPALAWRFDDVQPLGWTEAAIKPNGLELKLHTLDKNHPKNNDVRTFEWLR
ncbi:MAG: metallophosphoesterase [Planctomycetaceae bacterium]|nr:metallophosphoesterase [Planctomycetaceae bacterium]